MENGKKKGSTNTTFTPPPKVLASAHALIETVTKSRSQAKKKADELLRRNRLSRRKYNRKGTRILEERDLALRERGQDLRSFNKILREFVRWLDLLGKALDGIEKNDRYASEWVAEVEKDYQEAANVVQTTSKNALTPEHAQSAALDLLRDIHIKRASLRDQVLGILEEGALQREKIVDVLLCVV